MGGGCTEDRNSRQSTRGLGAVLAAPPFGIKCSERRPGRDEHRLAAAPVPAPSAACSAAAWEVPTSATTAVSGSTARPGIA